MVHELNIGEYPVQVHLCRDGYWKHDTIFIWNTSKCISEKEAKSIIQYLYDEGFISDRRTKWFIAEKDREDENGDTNEK